MAEKWNIHSPDMTQQPQDAFDLTAQVEEALAEGDDVRAKHFADERLDFVEGQALDFVGCIFERCAFGEMDLKRISFVDCIFDKCEWSNVCLNSSTFQRVCFRNCRLTGVEFLRGVLMNAVFEDCMMDYASLSETKLDRVAFNKCRMRESMWNQVALLKARFSVSDLSKVQWIRTPLMGIDVSTCQTDGWTISLFDLKGVKMTAAQVIGLSGLLGVEIIP